jgi:two-component system sensor histidine kinase/response regulator
MALPKILVVDDEKDNLDALRRLLRHDFQVSTALSGEEALALVAEQRDFDVLVSDQRMPKMTGAQFFEKVQALDKMPTRILLTGFADVEAVVEAVNKGHIWRYVSKPWEPDDLKMTLRQASERTRLSRSLEQSRRDLTRALGELRAKDWARERLLHILLHEFRTAPQILSSLKSLDGPGDAPVRRQFVENLEKRFGIIESDITSLLEEEKIWAKTPKAPVRLSEVMSEIAAETKVAFRNDASDEAPILVAPKELKLALRHVLELLLRNDRKAPVTAHLESTGGPQKSLFLTLRASANGPILPLSLAGQKLEAQVAWSALMEPFVGADDFRNHSSGLRVETAKWVRLLSSWGARPEFQLSGNEPGKTCSVELIFVFKSLES